MNNGMKNCHLDYSWEVVCWWWHNQWLLHQLLGCWGPPLSIFSVFKPFFWSTFFFNVWTKLLWTNPTQLSKLSIHSTIFLPPLHWNIGTV